MSKHKVTIEFGTGNAAFDYANGPSEAHRILTRIAQQINDGYEMGGIYDSNGNRVGDWKAVFPAHTTFPEG